MKIIYINSKKHGTKECLVDDADYPELIKHKWKITKSRNAFYASRWDNTRKRHVSMSRQIMGLTNPEIQCDHKDQSPLNNQRNNLRICTRRQNLCNRRKFKNSTSIYKGVYLQIRRGKTATTFHWFAQICVNTKVMNLGCFKTETEAAQVYNKAAIKHHGEFASINTITLTDEKIIPKKQRVRSC
jgi:hypothetical protein